MHTHLLKTEIENLNDVRAKTATTTMGRSGGGGGGGVTPIDLLLTSAKQLYALREAILQNNWDKAAINPLVLHSSSTAAASPSAASSVSSPKDQMETKVWSVIGSEINVVKNYCMTRQVRGALRNALTNGKRNTHDVRGLDAAIR